MKDDYHINLEEYSLNKFKTNLVESKLIPSREILKEDIDQRFKVLEDNDICNLQELKNVLKTPKKSREFAAITGLPEDYILILRREVNSYNPNPVNLDKFPGINSDTISKLQKVNLKNTRHLFEKVKTPDDREKLASELEISLDEIMELTKLTDLSRVKWVGPVFARIFVDSGTDTVEKMSQSDAEPLYKKLVELNQENRYTKSKFQESDVELCIKVSKLVPNTIKY